MFLCHRVATKFSHCLLSETRNRKNHVITCQSSMTVLQKKTELFSMIITRGEMWVYGYKQHTSNSYLSGKTPYLHAQERQDKFAQTYGGLN